MKKILNFIFSTKNEQKNNKFYKVVTILGFKIKVLNKFKTLLCQVNNAENNFNEKLEVLNFNSHHNNDFYILKLNELNDICNAVKIKTDNFEVVLNTVIQKNISTALLHQKTFLPFKNKYEGQTVVLVAAGPSVNKFKKMDNVIYVGVNRAFKRQDIDFDYLFAIDKLGIKDCEEGFANYRPNKCIKFLGYQDLGEHWQIPEDFANSFDCLRYKTTINLPQIFKPDIESHPLFNSCTVSIQAMQFILYTNPKKIYIVGVDCTGGTQGHFDGSSFNAAFRNENIKANDDYQINDWKRIKKFAQIHYPKTEIMSVNPVGLKGIFKDIYME